VSSPGERRLATRELIRRIVAATELSPGLSWFGEPVELGVEEGADVSPDLRHTATVRTLQRLIYERCYCLGAPQASAPRRRVVASSDSRERFLTTVRERLPVEPAHEPGWRVLERRPTSLTVTRTGLTLDVKTREVLLDGDAATLLADRLSTANAPGYLSVFGTRPPSGPLVRLYWSPLPSAVPRLVAGLFRLDQAKVPFAAKFLADPSGYERADAGVLYLGAEHVARAWPVVAATYAEVAHALCGRTPAFTLRLRPGLAFAEDPPDGDSFGQHVSRALAEAIVAADPHAGPDERTRQVCAALERAGFDLARPHCHGGADRSAAAVAGDDRAGTATGDGRAAREAGDARSGTATGDAPAGTGTCDARAATGVSGRWLPPTRRNGAGSRWDAKTTALEVAARLTERSVEGLHGPAWLTTPLYEQPPKYPERVLAGPDLYDGTAGIALFLGEVAARTGAHETVALAVDAMHGALRRAEPTHPGLHVGCGGIALAAARLAESCGEPTLAVEAVRLIGEALEQALERKDDAPLDLLTGSAGLVAAACAHRSFTEDPGVSGLARRVGDVLLARAGGDDRACWWAPDVDASAPALTGLSHGASGIGWALLELGRVTGDARHRDAAAGAFRFERRHLDPDAGNWTDRRPVERGGPAGQHVTAWCHDAGGMALVRLRAAELTGSHLLRREARTALATVQREVVARTGERGTSTLCHGLAGLVDIVLHDRRARRATALTTAADWAAREWDREDTPIGLMCGLTGIGHLALRWADQTAPSVLLPHR
jgi:hypothetical protein